MASGSTHVSEDQFLCAICLDVFIHPVATSCGHNFCKACISQYWDGNLFKCPVYNTMFEKRPDLLVNTFISELAAPFRKSMKAPSSPNHHPISDVSCDICTGRRGRAQKACQCQISYCEFHLEPHQRVTGLKKHELIDPVDNLEDRMCKKHKKPLELFCKTDQTCVCQYCTETDHKTHNTVPLEHESVVRMKKRDGEMQHMSQERVKKVQHIRKAVQLATDVISSIQRRQAELLQVILTPRSGV